MVLHLVFDGVADGPLGVALDIVGAAAQLRAARPRPARARVPARGSLQRVVSVDGRPVRSAAGRLVPVDGALVPRELGRRDVVVVPGLGAATPPRLAAALARADVSRGLALLAEVAARGARLAASCSATFVLGAAGVLDGHEATTTWWLAPEFARRFPAVTLRADRMVVASGRVLTAGAALAHADLVLALVAATDGVALAHTVARYLVLDERPSQARYMVVDHLRSADPVIRRLERFVTAHLDRPLTLAELARATATSPRTLARRVATALATTPTRLVQRLRVARAVHLLETTDRSVDDIAGQVGYADAAAFRRIFRRETGDAPSACRRRTGR